MRPIVLLKLRPALVLTGAVRSISGSPWCCTLNQRRAGQFVGFTPENLSGLVASRCQLLPVAAIDPNATVSIDLHKRLFLLVTGRGE